MGIRMEPSVPGISRSMPAEKVAPSGLDEESMASLVRTAISVPAGRVGDAAGGSDDEEEDEVAGGVSAPPKVMDWMAEMSYWRVAPL